VLTGVLLVRLAADVTYGHGNHNVAAIARIRQVFDYASLWFDGTASGNDLEAAVTSDLSWPHAPGSSALMAPRMSARARDAEKGPIARVNGCRVDKPPRYEAV
jgi:hypothetical protein